MEARSKVCRAAIAFVYAALSTTTLLGGVIPVGPTTFPAGSLLIDFTGVPDGTEVNGLSVDGVTFSYTVAGNPLNGAVQIDGGPGVTNNINPLNIVSRGDPTGTLTMVLSSPANRFGYGYALLASSTVADATTMSLYSGATLLGSLSYTGVPDPTFTGGFAGIESTDLFNRVAVTFNPTAGPAFAVDNVQIAAVPEPSTTLLTLAGGIGIYWVKRARRTRPGGPLRGRTWRLGFQNIIRSHSPARRSVKA